jgi:hypothetical protein
MTAELQQFLSISAGIILFSLFFYKPKKDSKIKSKVPYGNSKITALPESSIFPTVFYGSPFYSPKRKKLKYYEPTKKNPNRR